MSQKPPEPWPRPQRLSVGPQSVPFGMDDLPWVRRVTAQWAAAAGLAPGRADDFVLAVHEIAANAVLHGAPPARLVLRAPAGSVVAEVHDRGRWVTSAGPGGRPGGRGLPLARKVCDEVEIRAQPDGTAVLLRMRLPGPRPVVGDQATGQE